MFLHKSIEFSETESRIVYLIERCKCYICLLFLHLSKIATADIVKKKKNCNYSEEIKLDIPCESAARQVVHMKFSSEVLFSVKKLKKNTFENVCCLNKIAANNILKHFFYFLEKI